MISENGKESPGMQKNGATQSVMMSTSLSMETLSEQQLPLDERSKSTEVFPLPSIRAKTSQNKRFTKTDLLFCPMSNFGRDGPKITIGNAVVKPAFLKDESPGPGQYQYQEDTSRKGFSISRSDPRSYYHSETANADLQNVRVFPTIRPIKLGSRTGKPFYELPSTPAPSFLPPSTLASTGHKITSRRDPAPANIPGPGQYSPTKINLENAPSYSIPTYNVRDGWLVDKDHMPGPGQYNPSLNHIYPNRHSYSIGSKSTKHNRSKHVVAFGSFIYNLPPDISMQETEQYMKDHPQFKEFIQSLMNWVIKQKFDNPLEIIREKFKEERRAYEDRRYQNLTRKIREFKNLVESI